MIITIATFTTIGAIAGALVYRAISRKIRAKRAHNALIDSRLRSQELAINSIQRRITRLEKRLAKESRK